MSACEAKAFLNITVHVRIQILCPSV